MIILELFEISLIMAPFYKSSDPIFFQNRFHTLAYHSALHPSSADWIPFVAPYPSSWRLFLAPSDFQSYLKRRERGCGARENREVRREA